MVISSLKSVGTLAVLLACSACAPAAQKAAPSTTVPPAPAASAPAEPVVVDQGLPALPEASGSARRGGSYAALPAAAKQMLEHLQCKVDGTAHAQVFTIPGPHGRTDFMATDKSGPGFQYWIRTFAGSGDSTGYLVQLNGCPATTAGMRAYIAKGAAAPVDVTADILANGGFPNAEVMATYTAQGASDLFALTLQLDKVPVVRWIAEADPDRHLHEDARTFDHGNFIHGGFLVWADDRFDVKQQVPAAMWPCDDSQFFRCEGDPFVTGR